MSEAFEKQAQLYAALSRAQGKFPPIPRNRTVTVRTKTGGSYKFDYAPLETILDHVRAPLAAEGLAISQALLSEEGHTFLETSLLHANGGVLSSKLVLSRAEQLPPQELGSLLTYLRRYSLQALLGIATEEDDDANSASGNTVTRQETRKTAGESRAAPGPEPPADQPPAPSPANTRHAQIAERWNALSAGEAKAKAAAMTDADLLRELRLIEHERKGGPRTTVQAALSRRIQDLEGGEPTAVDDQPGTGPVEVSQAGTEPVSDPGSAPEPASSPSKDGTLLKLQAAIGWVKEQPTSVDDPAQWTPVGILAGLLANGAGSYGSLEEVPDQWLKAVYEALPVPVRASVERLGPEALASLAGQP